MTGSLAVTMKTAKAVAFTGCQKDQSSSPGTKVPVRQGTPLTRFRPEDARSSSLVGKHAPPPKHPKGGGLWGPGSGALLSSQACLAPWGAAGRSEDCPGAESAP